MLLSITLNPKKCIADRFLLVLPWRKRLLKLGQRLSYLKRNGFEELDFNSL